MGAEHGRFRRQFIEFDRCDKHGAGTAKSIEKGYHLRHGGHFNAHGSKITDGSSHYETAHDPSVIV